MTDRQILACLEASEAGTWIAPPQVASAMRELLELRKTLREIDRWAASRPLRAVGAAEEHVPGEMCPTYLAAKREWERELEVGHAKLVEVADKLRTERLLADALLLALESWMAGGRYPEGSKIDVALRDLRGARDRARSSREAPP